MAKVTGEQIKHEQKHQVLKRLAEAGRAIVLSNLPNEKKSMLYSRIQRLIGTITSLKEADSCSCEVERETEEMMELKEALDCLSDGHSLWTPKVAYQICKATGVEYPRELEQHWYSDWSDFKGMHMSEGAEGSLGIWSLALSEYVAEQLGVKEKAGSFLGRGSQAQAYARQIGKVLGVQDE